MNDRKPFTAVCYSCLFFLFAVMMMALPSCSKVLQLKNPEKSPEAVFDDAWSVIDERYALFPVKTVNWAEAYALYRPHISTGMSDNSLFSIVSDLLSTLKDGHVSLISSDKSYTYDNFYTAYAINFNYNNLINNYLKNDYINAGPLIYTIRDSVGYLYYDSFEKDISAPALDSLLLFMRNTKAMIVDVRGNHGGATRNVRQLFQRFLPQRKLVSYEIGKNGTAHDDFAAQEALFIDGVAAPYTKPVCVLTNRSCFSACNDFALFMSELPNVILVGDSTGGGGGIPVRYVLANGWTLQYTATITLSPENDTIENGIAPRIQAAISNLDEQYGKDPILEKAFFLLR
jgi:hypothetical protein